jgi:hypothetical protein
VHQMSLMRNSGLHRLRCRAGMRWLRMPRPPAQVSVLHVQHRHRSAGCHTAALTPLQALGPGCRPVLWPQARQRLLTQLCTPLRQDQHRVRRPCAYIPSAAERIILMGPACIRRAPTASCCHHRPAAQTVELSLLTRVERSRQAQTAAALHSSVAKACCRASGALSCAAAPALRTLPEDKRQAHFQIRRKQWLYISSLLYITQ